MTKRIVLANQRGFCAGVDRAIQTVDTILRTAGPRADGLPPVYERRQIVHNKHVDEQLAGRGAEFDEFAEPTMTMQSACCDTSLTASCRFDVA